jgi:TfoX/Sxy family transcriptional regulator of competence genes
MPNEAARKRRLRAIFASMADKQKYVRGTQQSLKGAKEGLKAYENFTGKNKAVAKAYLTYAINAVGLPNQLITNAKRAEKLAADAKKMQVKAENIRKVQILAAKGLPIKGKMSQGRPGWQDMIPPQHYVKYKGKNEKFKGWHFDPNSAVYKELISKDPKPGRPKGS